MGSKPDAIAGALPDTLTPFSSLQGGSIYRAGMGVLCCIPAPGILAGGQYTIKHGLNRVPNLCQVLDNPGAYKGDCFFVSKTANSCVVQFEMALSPFAVVRII